MTPTPTDPAAVRAFFEAWTRTANSGDWDGFAALLHPDVVATDPMSPDAARGAPAVLARAQWQYAPFPDGRTAVLGEPFTSVTGDRLGYNWRFTGTFSHPIDPPGFAPTGAQLHLEGVSLLELADGRVIRLSMFFDATDVARQIGAAPAPGSPLERAAVLVQRARARLGRRR